MTAKTALVFAVIASFAIACGKKKTTEPDEPIRPLVENRPTVTDLPDTNIVDTISDGLITCHHITGCKLAIEKEVASKQEKLSRFSVSYRTNCGPMAWGISLKSDEQVLPLNPSTREGFLTTVLFGLGPVTFFDEYPNITVRHRFESWCKIQIEKVEITPIQ